MNVERLQQLKRVLNEVIEQKKLFSMQAWVNDTACGTTACAAGWAGLDPWFIEQGLYTSRRHHTVEYNGHAIFYYGLADFFDIEQEDSIGLFSPDSYGEDDGTPEEVIARIDQLLEGRV